MTTIAVKKEVTKKGRILYTVAADTQSTWGGKRPEEAHKINVEKHGIYAACGDCQDERPYFEAWKNGTAYPVKTSDDLDFQSIWVGDHGLLVMTRGSLWHSSSARYFVIGNCIEAVIVLMREGVSPEDAIRKIAEIEPYTGVEYGVDVARWQLPKGASAFPKEPGMVIGSFDNRKKKWEKKKRRKSKRR